MRFDSYVCRVTTFASLTMVYCSLLSGQSIMSISPTGTYLTVPAAVNADGSVVVGYYRQTALSQDRAFRWSVSLGFEDLGLLPEPCCTYSQATCVSDDGNVIGGYGGDNNGGSDGCGGAQARAFRWTRESGMVTLPWGGVAPCGGGGASASGISGDGTVMVGSSNFGCHSYACTWIFPVGANPEFRKLNFFDPVSGANGISSDGQVAVGAVSSPVYPCRWVSGSGAQAIPSPGSPAVARAVNADGTVIIGNVTTLYSSIAFRYTSQGVQSLGSLSSGGLQYDGAYAWDVSGDGEFVVGESTISYVGTFAFLWTPSLGMVNLNTYLPTIGIAINGWTLGGTTAVSENGSTLVGWGSSSSGKAAWRVTLNSSVWSLFGAGVAGTNGIPVLSGGGSLAPGSSGSLSLTSANPTSSSILFGSLASSPISFVGGTLFAYPVSISVPLLTSANGNSVLPFTWPTGIPSGTSLYFQFAVQDDAAHHGVALSNALRAVTP